MNRIAISFYRNGAMALVLAGLCGCATAPQLHYVPNPPVTQKPVIPLRIAVRPFLNATEEKPVAQKMFMIPALFMNSRFVINMARSASPQMEPYMAAEKWGHWLATDLAHSGLFQEVKEGPAGNLSEQDIILEGSLDLASFTSRIVVLTLIPIYVSSRQDYAFSVRALRSRDGKVLWQGSVKRSFNKGVSSEEQGIALLRNMMFQAGQDLVKGLQARQADWPEGSATHEPDAGSSVEDILKKVGAQ